MSRTVGRFGTGQRVVEVLHAKEMNRTVYEVLDDTYEGMGANYVMVRPVKGGSVELFHQRDLERTSA